MPSPPPAAQDPSPEDPFPGKARMLAHMNADHGDDLSLILQHALGLSRAAAAGAKLEDADLATLTVRSASGRHAVAVAPPMAAWADRRDRVVRMTRAARAALAPVPRYHPPARPADLAVFLAVALYFACCGAVAARLPDPGRPLAAPLDAVFPGGAAGFRWLVRALLVPVLAIHLGETWFFERTRLGPRGPGRGSSAWWLWIGSCFFEGALAIRRFDRVAQGLEGQGSEGKEGKEGE